LIGIKDLITPFITRFSFFSNQGTNFYKNFIYKPLVLLTIHFIKKATISSSPRFSFSQFPSSTTQDAIVTFPEYLRLSQGKFNSLRDIPIWTMLIQIKSDIDEEKLKIFKSNLREIVRGKGISVQDVEEVNNIINNNNIIGI
jgi:hypothetical protein